MADKKYIVFIFLIAVALLAAGCKKDTITPDDFSKQCPLNMINPLSCKEGVVTFNDGNGCSVTKCKEDLQPGDTSIQGTENTLNSNKE